MSNMEIFYKPSPNITIKVEARGMEEMFQALAPIQEVLGNNTCCGKCGSNQVRLSHRKTPDNKHDLYEIVCEGVNDNGFSCNAKLALGKNNMGNLFPRRYKQEKQKDGSWQPATDNDGKRVYLPDNGWVRWDSKKEDYV